MILLTKTIRNFFFFILFIFTGQTTLGSYGANPLVSGSLALLKSTGMTTVRAFSNKGKLPIIWQPFRLPKGMTKDGMYNLSDKATKQLKDILSHEEPQPIASLALRRQELSVVLTGEDALKAEKKTEKWIKYQGGYVAKRDGMPEEGYNCLLTGVGPQVICSDKSYSFRLRVRKYCQVKKNENHKDVVGQKDFVNKSKLEFKIKDRTHEGSGKASIKVSAICHDPYIYELFEAFKKGKKVNSAIKNLKKDALNNPDNNKREIKKLIKILELLWLEDIVPETELVCSVTRGAKQVVIENDDQKFVVDCTVDRNIAWHQLLEKHDSLFVSGPLGRTFDPSNFFLFPEVAPLILPHFCFELKYRPNPDCPTTKSFEEEVVTPIFSEDDHKSLGGKLKHLISYAKESA